MLLAILVAQQSLNNGITSDGALYFAHLRSVIFDHDLDIGPEIAALGQPARPHNVVPMGLWFQYDAMSYHTAVQMGLGLLHDAMSYHAIVQMELG